MEEEQKQTPTIKNPDVYLKGSVLIWHDAVDEATHQVLKKRYCDAETNTEDKVNALKELNTFLQEKAPEVTKENFARIVRRICKDFKKGIPKHGIDAWFSKSQLDKIEKAKDYAKSQGLSAKGQQESWNEVEFHKAAGAKVTGRNREISMTANGMKYTTNLTFESSGSQLASKAKQLKELLNDESTDHEILELLG